MSNLMLSNRLMTAVGFARGGVFADVGTDHGYLPIYLYKKGLVKRAVASDIHKMPLDSARKNIALHGAVGGIDTVLSDGLKALKDFAPDDIAIFGMGGELICRIVGDAPWTKAEFFDSHIVFVQEDETNYYHCYDCESFTRNGYRAYNKQQAVFLGYTPCPHCQ